MTNLLQRVHLLHFIYVIFFTVLFVPAFASAATYYVSTTGNDSNTGTQASPWKTVAKACSTVAAAGDTIHIGTGTFTESGQCILAKGVNLEGEGKTATIIKSTITGTWSTYMELVSPAGTNGNQSISNFTLNGQTNTTGNASGTWFGIWVMGRSNVSIHDVKFMNFFNSAALFAGHDTTNPTTWAGPFATGNSFYNNEGTNCAGIIPEAGWSGSGCLLIGGQDGMDIHHNNLNTTARPIERNGWPIKYWDNGFLKGVKIHDNTLTKSPFHSTQPFSPPNWDFAVELFNVQGMEFNNNYVQGSVDINYIYKGTYPYGLWAHHNTLDHNPGNFTHFESGFVFEYKAERVIVENNTINNKSAGISFNTRTPNNTGGYTFPCGTGGCSANIDNVIRNNIFSNIYSSGGNSAGITVISEQGDDPYINNMQIYNNTFVAKSGQPANFGLDFTSQPNGNVNGLHIRNNIFQGFSVASIANQAAQTQSNVVITHNDTWNTPAPTFAGSGVTMNNNLAVNPSFVSTSDFHLQSNSPVIDKGINVGLPYNGAAPDMGAYETGGTGTNQPPTANAGPDQTITLPTNSVTLNGSGTDPDGTITAYAWTKVSTLAATITTPASATTTVTGLVQGVHTFQLRVTDNNGATGTDTVQITVNQGGDTTPPVISNIVASGITTTGATITWTTNEPSDTQVKYGLTTTYSSSTTLNTSMVTAHTAALSGLSPGTLYHYQVLSKDAAGNLAVSVDKTFTTATPSNLPPTANAGPDQSITLPISSVTLNGSGTDPDGIIASYLWTQAAPTTPLATIVSPNSASTQITGLAQGTYVFWLKVTDNNGATATDQVTVTVNPAVIVATSYTFTGPTTGAAGATSSNFTLTPNGPYTGTITVAISGAGLNTSVVKTFTNSSAPQTFTITPSTSGTVTLTPTNSGGLTNPVARTYIVATASNLPPTANAGPDQTITLPNNSVTLSGSGTDPDGTIVAYQWSKIQGPTGGTITSPTSAQTLVTVLTQGIYVFQLKVTDNAGATATDNVQITVNPVQTNPGIYATWNPLDKGAKVTLSNNNLTASYGGGKGTVRSTIGKLSGKWYWEVKLTNAGNQFIGVANPSASLTNTLGFDTKGWSIVVDDGARFNGGNQGLWGPSFVTGDVVGVALDIDGKKINLYKNGSYLGTMFTNLSGTMYAAWGGEYSGSGTANFGATSFSYGVPAGYNPGLYGASAPTIGVGSRVETTAKVNVRSGPGTGYSSYGTQLKGADGTVIEGPSGSGPWWKVNFDTGVDGWVKATYLKLL